MIEWDQVAAVLVTRPGGQAEIDRIRESLPPVAETVVWRNGEAAEVYRDDGLLVDQGELDVAALRAGEDRTNRFPDLGVYGRYAAIAYTSKPVIIVQDDDCIVERHAWDELRETYRPGRISALMPFSRWDDYPDSCLVGWGALFDRGLPAEAFARFGFDEKTSPFLDDDWWDCRFTRHGTSVEVSSAQMFRRTSDVVFTTLTPHVKVVSELDVDWLHLPYAERADRMFRQPSHQEERQRMLELARAVRDSEPEPVAANDDEEAWGEDM